MFVRAGEGKVDKTVANVGKDIKGWRVGSLSGDRAHHHGDWLMRATAAKAGIYGNDAVEPMSYSQKTQIPSHLVVGRWASSVESRSILDFLCIHYA
jgi:hypothetical protein